MRKRILIALLVIFVLLLGIIVLPELLSSEPRYQGKRLSRWFKQYYREEKSDEDSLTAFRVMGTNALPYLLRELYSTDEDSRSQTNIQIFLSRLPSPFHFPRFVPAIKIRDAAADAIIETKPPAAFILPLVTNRLYGTDEYQRRPTLYLLCSLGAGVDTCMPILKGMLNSTNRRDNLSSLVCLQRLGPAAEPALPELVGVVRDQGTNSHLVHAACRALGEMGDAARPAIPYVQLLLAKETKPSSRINFARTLCSIDPGQTNALDVILGYARTPNDPNRGFAVVVLRILGPKAKAAAPTLAEIAREGAQDVWVSAAEGLANTGDTNHAVSIVAEKFASADPAVRLTAAMFVLTYQPTNSVALVHLAKSIHDETWGGVAIDQLSKLRPIPESSLATLREIANDKNNKFQKQAEKALSKIESEQAHK